MDGKVNMVWHQVTSTDANTYFADATANMTGVNVISPTWFYLLDTSGNIANISSADYVAQAHEKGLKVWGLIDNFTQEVSTTETLSNTAARQNIISQLIQAATSVGMDGINVDFEQLSSDCGPHYVEFIRELSIQCRNRGLVLSIANYVPFNFNDYYRLDIQGQVADYVIIMGYDEHWHGSKDPGSVASISYVSGGLDRTLQEVPANKVVNALPFYTILWKTEGTDVTDEYITMNNEADFMNRAGVTAEWDEETCQNYAEWTSGNATYQIWLEDAESIAVKLNMMATKNIGGVAVWRLGYGTQAAWELINAYLQ